MPEFRWNILTQEWVIIATERAKRPMAFAQTLGRTTLPIHDDACPFCPGNEVKTTAEVHRIPQTHAPWLTRTVKNKFPALHEHLEPTTDGDLFHTHIQGFGIHEVIIDTPYHHHGIPNLSLTDTEKIIATYRHRYRAHESDPRVRHIVIFKNNGEKAGSSLVHPHSQLIATPIISQQIANRLQITQKYRDEHQSCLMCDMLQQELDENQRIVDQNEHFVAFMPYAALSSFHTWIFPRQHHAHFGRLTDTQIPALAQILSRVLKAQERLLNYPDYNFVVRSAPTDCCDENYHWYISIIPRLSKTAGFEIGSNIFINPSRPEHDALEMRNIIDLLGHP